MPSRARHIQLSMSEPKQILSSPLTWRTKLSKWCFLGAKGTPAPSRVDNGMPRRPNWNASSDAGKRETHLKSSTLLPALGSELAQRTELSRFCLLSAKGTPATLRIDNGIAQRPNWRVLVDAGKRETSVKWSTLWPASASGCDFLRCLPIRASWCLLETAKEFFSITRYDAEIASILRRIRTQIQAKYRAWAIWAVEFRSSELEKFSEVTIQWLCQCQYKFQSSSVISKLVNMPLIIFSDSFDLFMSRWRIEHIV